MTPDLRAGDEDRRRAVDALQRHYVEGRLSADELSERVSQATSARTLGELQTPLADLPQRLDEIPVDRDVHVHCRSGGRSARAVDFLRDSGRPRALNVNGGIEAWVVAGLPVE